MVNFLKFLSLCRAFKAVIWLLSKISAPPEPEVLDDPQFLLLFFYLCNLMITMAGLQ